MVQSHTVRLLRRVFLSVRLLLVFLAAVLLLGSSVIPPSNQLEQARIYTREIEFDFLEWISDALQVKLAETALGAHRYLPKGAQRQIVVDYLELVRQIQQKEDDIEQVYANPLIGDPRSYSAQLVSDLNELYRLQDQTAPLVEAILQSQISMVVSELDLSLGGQLLPPILYHSTSLPLILIISPRDTIRMDESIALNGDLSVEQKVALEEQVDRTLNVSSLVESIGGLGLYPTMVAQSSSLNWLSDVVSHEWVHNFLTLRPLGINYDTSPELRVINETVASIAGKEISLEVLKRFYPEMVPREEPEPSAGTKEEAKTNEPPAFDFRKEMHETRVTADNLLAEGRIEEAESYMEARRKVFWENGYRWLRKLNQAYFAFHGAYADEPGGAAGATEDPVGAAVRELRAQSDSLSQFLKRISWITSFEELKRAIEENR